MSDFKVPWLLFAVLFPLICAGLVQRITDREQAKRWVLVGLGVSLLATIGEWIEFSLLNTKMAHDHWDVSTWLWGTDLLVVDAFSAPLLSLNALFAFLTVLATMSSKAKRISYSQWLISHSITQAMLCTTNSWLLILWCVLSLLPPWWELRQRGQNTRAYLLHAGLHVSTLIMGWGLLSLPQSGSFGYAIGELLLVIAILLRCWVAPFHCWLTDMFERLGFGTVLQFSAVLTGPYLAIRLGFEVLPDWGLSAMAYASAFTALYSAGMANVQTDVRRMYAFLFLSHVSFVLVGLEMVTVSGLAGSLCVWLGSTVSIVGLGLTLRSVEARFGRLSMTRYLGLYNQIPRLATLFLITGLAFVGFPGTIGFVSVELLVDGVLHHNPWLASLLVASAALSGLAVLRTYFVIFTGRTFQSSVSLRSLWMERTAIILLVLIVIGGSLFPQSFTESRLTAAKELLQRREKFNQATVEADGTADAIHHEGAEETE